MAILITLLNPTKEQAEKYSELHKKNYSYFGTEDIKPSVCKALGREVGIPLGQEVVVDEEEALNLHGRFWWLIETKRTEEVAVTITEDITDLPEATPPPKKEKKDRPVSQEDLYKINREMIEAEKKKKKADDFRARMAKAREAKKLKQ